MKALAIFGVVVGAGVIALSFLLETVEYTAEVKVSDIQEITFGPRRVKIDGLWIGNIEKMERKGDRFELEIDRYDGALEALIAIAGAVPFVFCLFVLCFKEL